MRDVEADGYVWTQRKYIFFFDIIQIFYIGTYILYRTLCRTHREHTYIFLNNNTK